MAIGAAVIITIGAFAANPSAQAVPPDFPNVDAQTMVSPADFFVSADQPENAGWRFSTARGLRCDIDLGTQGASCEYETSTVRVQVEITELEDGILELWPALPVPVDQRWSAWLRWPARQ